MWTGISVATGARATVVTRLAHLVWRRGCTLLVVMFAACQQESCDLTEEGEAVIWEVHGDDQVATAGSEIEVRVTTRYLMADGRYKPGGEGSELAWRIVAGDGCLVNNNGGCLSSIHGIYRNRVTWRLGSPGPQQLVVELNGRSTTIGATATAAPSLDVSAPAGVQVHVGSEARAAVAVVRSDTTGAVQLSVSGLPPGVTARFEDPDPAVGAYRARTRATAAAGTRDDSRTLVVNAAANASPGIHQLVIRAEWNGLAATAGVALAVLPSQVDPTITIGIAPQSLVLQPGAAGTATVSIDRIGVTGDVALVVTQVPGVTASLAPNPAPGAASTLTLQVADDATPGTHTLTVTGTAAGVTASAALTLQIEEPPDAGSPIVLEDDFEGPDRWTPIARRYRTPTGGSMVPEDNPWVHAVLPQPAGGNPDGYRRMTHTLTAQTAPDFVHIFVEHAFTRTDGTIYRYDPATEGAIASLDYSEDRVIFQFATYGTLFVRQNGIVYVLASSVDPGVNTFTNTTWERFTTTGLSAASFQAAPGFAPATPPRPDFSATGAPLEFGFVRGTSARFPISHVHGIDNWRVTIHR